MALTFATRFRVWPVLVGITVATAVVHLVSVGIGYGLGVALPTGWIELAAAVAFLAFGLWTLRGDTLTEEEKQKVDRAGKRAVIAVGTAFFLAELGDKTMLATVTLATQHGWFGTWLGSTAGMVAADALAIGLGRLLGVRLPERLVRRGAAALFAVFGCSLLADAAASFSGVPTTALLAGTPGRELAGWVALGIGLLAVGAMILLRFSRPAGPTGLRPRRAAPAPAGRGPGPYRAPHRARRARLLAGALLGVSLLLGLAAHWWPPTCCSQSRRWPTPARWWSAPG
jgi:putative Ca2+/H+ antiporter (TMEM165/GDT1 family)